MLYLDWRFLPVYDQIDPTTAHSGAYDVGLVALSIVVATLAAFVALSISGRIVASNSRGARWAWASAGALAMGGGIWSMHFIGMLAFSLPCGVTYAPVGTVLSMIPGILASGLALHVISQRPHPRFKRLPVGRCAARQDDDLADVPGGADHDLCRADHGGRARRNLCRTPGRAGAEPRRRDRRAQAHRTGTDQSAPAGRSSQPRQITIPRDDEPRNPNTDERRRRHRQSARHDTAQRPPAATRQQPRRVGPGAARHHQRYSRPVEDRGRAFRAGKSGVRSARADRGSYRPI